MDKEEFCIEYEEWLRMREEALLEEELNWRRELEERQALYTCPACNGGNPACDVCDGIGQLNYEGMSEYYADAYPI